MDKVLIEVMFKKDDTLLCQYMDAAVTEVMNNYEEYAQYHLIDIRTDDGRKRFLELSVSLYGEESVYKGFQIAPIPSLFINGHFITETIPSRPALTNTIESFIEEQFPTIRYGKGKG